ncbi:MAG: DUF1571 domain-containing protein [Flavobacteriales bacterium]|nr:DUF1571 domain-containing protein [Flavobacteriales bacterium]
MNLKLLIILVFSAWNSYAQSSEELLQKLFESIEKYHTLVYDFKMTERVENRYVSGQTVTTVRANPYAVYIKKLAEDKVVEVLYNKERGEDALVNPGSFPWVNLNLDPYSSLMRKNKHQTLFASGFSFFGNILKSIVDEGSDQNKFTIKEQSQGQTLIFERLDYKKSIFTNPKTQTTTELANSKRLSEYAIIESNESLDEYGQVIAKGDQIELPNCYAKKMVLFIDPKTFLPFDIKVYDEKGLYEHYEYKNIQVNPTLDDNEFQPNCKSYNF